MAASFANFHVLFLIWFLSATFSLSFYFFKAESISNVSCNQKDKQALLTLKRGLTDHGHVLSSWSDHKDCCIWDRVFCDNKTGRVSELHLSYSRYIGNPQLCGDPLPKNCTIEEQFLNRSPIGSVEDDSKNSSFYIAKRDVDEAKAEQFNEMACKTSLADQQKQLQENIHAQIKSFSLCINEILLLYTKRIAEAQELPPQPIAAPCQSGLGFDIGRNGQPTDPPGDQYL
nr:polygalacturonase inhibitor [Quercus suber]